MLVFISHLQTLRAYYSAKNYYLAGRRCRRFFDFVIDRRIHLNLVKFDDAEPAPDQGPQKYPPANYLEPNDHQ